MSPEPRTAKEVNFLSVCVINSFKDKKTEPYVREVPENPCP